MGAACWYAWIVGIIPVMSSLPNAIREDITQFLRDWSDGDPEALERAWPLIYREMRAMAARMMQGERRDHTLQATDLVHEAFLRLVDQRRVRWQDRRHFFAIAARMMRRILVNHARRRASLKRGGDLRRTVLSETDHAWPEIRPDVVAVDDALSAFEIVDPEKARIVELRFFAGLSNLEIAELLGCSEKTIRRHWKVAQIWLYRELAGTSNREP